VGHSQAGRSGERTAFIVDAAVEVVVFALGEGRAALRAQDVKEIQRVVAIVPLPRAPAVVEGFVNLRGAVVPVVDLRARLGLSPSPVSHTDHLVFAWAGRRLVALRVDRAQSLVKLAPGDVESQGQLPCGAEHLAGVAKLPDGLVLIHDLRALLTQAEALELDDVLARTPGAPS
jgi:purine-binding chemotaxis protein CheW